MSKAKLMQIAAKLARKTDLLDKMYGLEENAKRVISKREFSQALRILEDDFNRLAVSLRDVYDNVQEHNK